MEATESTWETRKAWLQAIKAKILTGFKWGKNPVFIRHAVERREIKRPYLVETVDLRVFLIGANSADDAKESVSTPVDLFNPWTQAPDGFHLDGIPVVSVVPVGPASKHQGDVYPR